MYGVYVQWNSGQKLPSFRESIQDETCLDLSSMTTIPNTSLEEKEKKKATPKAFQHDTHQFTKTLTSWICIYLFEYFFLQLKCWNITDHTQLFQVENLHKSDRQGLFQPTVIFKALHCFKRVL